MIDTLFDGTVGNNLTQDTGILDCAMYDSVQIRVIANGGPSVAANLTINVIDDAGNVQLAYVPQCPASLNTCALTLSEFGTGNIVASGAALADRSVNVFPLQAKRIKVQLASLGAAVGSRMIITGRRSVTQ